jgi:hypothetical protein
VARLSIRGNRDFPGGYDITAGLVELLGAADAVLWSKSYSLPADEGDLDIVLSAPVTGVMAVRFTALLSDTGAGLAEVEVFGP